MRGGTLSKQPRKLNILHIATHTKISRGGAVQLMRLVRGLRDKGHNVSCAVGMGKDGKPVPETVETFKQEKIPCYFFNLKSIPALLEIRKFLKLNNFDVVHTHRDPALVMLLKATIGMTIPVITANRGTTQPLTKYSLKWFAYRSKKLDRAITVAQAVKDSIVNTAGVNPDKVDVVYGSVCLKNYHPGIDGSGIRKEFHIEPDTPVVGLVAEMHPKKGHHYFLDAAKVVLEKIPNAKFLMAGGGKADSVMNYAKELGIFNNCIFASFRKDVPQVLAALDVSVCSSTRGEGLTGTLRESLAIGTPAISTDVSGNSEIIINEKTGLLVPPKDTPAMANAIVRILTDKKLADTLSQNGLALIKEKFTNELRVNTVEKLYYNILKKKNYL